MTTGGPVQRRQGDKDLRRKAGFTLNETLLVVGIHTALLALSSFAVRDGAGSGIWEAGREAAYAGETEK